MGRAPCCVKEGLNRGPWSAEEDRKLTAYIQENGHANWRALPNKAGLLRCGKSCRLRWINYLRPDLKRGDFTKEEEEAIINLHAMLGNKWSRIAASLGRTDNEIKNVWNTHLKKRQAANQSSNNNKGLDSERRKAFPDEKLKLPAEFEGPHPSPMSPESTIVSSTESCTLISDPHQQGLAIDNCNNQENVSTDAPDISSEPGLWNMMGDDGCGLPTAETEQEVENSAERVERERWFAYFEKELDL